MRKRIRAPFDPKKFLAKVGDGKTILHYRKNQIVFSQGEVADSVFYIQQGSIRFIVVSEQGKRPLWPWSLCLFAPAVCIELLTFGCCYPQHENATVWAQLSSYSASIVSSLLTCGL